MVVETGIVDSIHYTTVARILARATLHPHRSRLWKTAELDERFVARAAKILWCYERVEWLFKRGEVVLCVDEKPNIQALSRCAATHPMRSGQIQRREFEYQRHGTVIFLVAFNVFDGTMWGTCLARNDHQHFLWAMRQVARRFAAFHRIHLILDNGSSHIDHHTHAYFQHHPQFRVLFTPAHASWLNQAELLLRGLYRQISQPI